MPSAPCRAPFLVLVCPAAVVRHGTPAEFTRLRFEVRIVHEHDAELSLHVHALVVIPIAFRGGHAVPEEHHGHIAELHSIDVGRRRADRDVLALRQWAALAVRRRAHIHRPGDVELRERHVLRPGPLAVLQVATG
jgi:hypothetical protein